MRNKIAIALGPLLFILMVAIAPEENKEAYYVLAVALWMLTWWLTEVVDLAVTAFLPLLMFPLLSVSPIKEVASNYAHPIIYLFFGGFVLALALEKWNLHKRMALTIIKASGSGAQKVLLGFMLATAFLSMWISNTATTVMMLPIVMSVIQVLGKEEGNNKMAFTLLIGVAWAANVGGIATLIGTPPNLILAGFLKDNFDHEIYFSDWLVIGVPISGVLLLSAFLILKKGVKGVSIAGSSSVFNEQLKELGPMSIPEKRVAFVFGLTALAWILRPLLTKIGGLENLSDTGIALASAILLFVFPNGKKVEGGLLHWKDTKGLAWGILILFGGGLALAQGLSKSGLLESLSAVMTEWDVQFPLLLLLAMAFIGVFVTELVSNMALVAAFLPLMAVVAKSFGLPFMDLALPLTIGASCAFMLPTATPPNAIVYSSKMISIPQMARVGFVMNIFSVLVITAMVYFLSKFVL